MRGFIFSGGFRSLTVWLIDVRGRADNESAWLFLGRAFRRGQGALARAPFVFHSIRRRCSEVCGSLLVPGD